MRALLLAALLVLTAPSAWAGPPTTDEALADWAARDLEGRWALLAREPDLAAGLLSDEWTTFLERRGEWALLEWAALATDRSPAMPALKRAGRPTWMRCAIWGLSNMDSHSLGSASAELDSSPALVLGWLKLHPGADTGLARNLGDRFASTGVVPDVEGARRLEPPYDAERLLAALTPPREVPAFGDRTRAEPGVTYLHQVERALAVWMRSPMRGEPWEQRVAALLSHPSHAVRRAVALACSLKRPGPALLRGMLALLDDPAVAPDARSAALVALSLWATPEVSLRLLDIALDPRHPSFTAAASAAADRDRGYLLRAWEGLDVRPAGPVAAAFVQAQHDRLEQRLAAEDSDVRASAVAPMLGLAAYADLVAWPRAAALTTFTVERLGEQARGEPKVRERLAALRADAAASAYLVDPEHVEGVRLRARTLAERALAAADAPPR
jgi:hypothetical protein